MLTENILTTLAGRILEQVIPELPGRIRRLLEADAEGSLLLRQALTTGLSQAVQVLGPRSIQDYQRYNTVLDRFLKNPDVAASIARLVDLPQDVSEEQLAGEIAELYAQLEHALDGQPLSSEPGKDREALLAFLDGYRDTIRREPDKLPWINVHYLDAQVQSVSAILNRLHAAQASSPTSGDSGVQAYLTWLRDWAAQLSLPGLDTRPGRDGVRLANVYVDTEVFPLEWGLPGDQRRRGVVDLLGKPRGLLLVGAPGSGKSTTIANLAHALAQYHLGSSPDGVPHDAWPQSDPPIPVLVPPHVLSNDGQSVDGLVKCIFDEVDRRARGQASAKLLQKMEDSEVLLLVDGIGEGGQPTQAKQFDAIRTLSLRFPGVSVLATSRSRSDSAWTGISDFAAAEIAPFNDAQVKRFLERWYTEFARLGVLAPEYADNLVTQTTSMIFDDTDVHALASSPLLLQALVAAAVTRGRLPRRRAVLYEEWISSLLLRWDQSATADDAPDLSSLMRAAGRTLLDFEHALWRLAFDLYGRSRNGDIAARTIADNIRHLHPSDDWGWAQHVIRCLRDRNGLLVETGPEIFAFVHHTIQKYLAGAHLCAQGDFSLEAAALAEKPHWREVILFGVGRLVDVVGDLYKPLALVEELYARSANPKHGGWQAAWLAGDVLLEIGLNRVQDSAPGNRLLDRVAKRLDQLLSADGLSESHRAGVRSTVIRLQEVRPAPA